MQVAEAIKVVFKSNQPYISIVFDKERLKALHMEDSFESIKNAIADHKTIKKFKLKREVRIPFCNLFPTQPFLCI